MPVSSNRSTRAIAVAALLSAVLSGCAVKDTYTDATEPDAAKVRFIANTSNAKLYYYDPEHCEGRVTGELNNLYARDTERRVGMSVAPPADAKGFLEIKVKPDQDNYLHLGTSGSNWVCVTSLSLAPERNAEYEVTLNLRDGRCGVLLNQLKRIDGRDVRLPMPVMDKGLPACVGRGTSFPILPPVLPDTPHRVMLIDQIFDSATIAQMKPDPAKDSSARFTPEKLDKLIAERKAKLGFTLPDDYWALYRQNLIAFDEEAAGNKAETFKRYSDKYRLRLQRLTDQQLEQWAHPEDKASRPTHFVASEERKTMTKFYVQTSQNLLLETINHHLDRMAQMDRQYGVCARYSECWKR
ncbi:hypothetical protein FBY04_107236 [Pseudomonas sp. SJZ080]|jgi:hypothetical protein|uniref:hypothetical protein n=1 Tax=Pseudomonas sp. SJZ080 TaxID=2572888 RepID=UPI00119BF73A|nr:hypothetical protein [Pseudomonas sp. SJZ080]TWC56661.1 hypothetical protein FBY04_107236 [Pseudomonas sp. SJZ080]